MAIKSVPPGGNIQRAIDRARPGDTIQLSGTYEHQKIVCAQAVRLVGGDDVVLSRCQVVPQVWKGDHDNNNLANSFGLTIERVRFHGSMSDKLVRAGAGLVLRQVEMREIPFGINVRGSPVLIEDCLIEHVNSPDAHAIVASGATDLRIVRTTWRHINTRQQIGSASNSAVTKLLHTTGLVVDSCFAEDVVGPGLWLDWDNVKFSIRGLTVRNARGNRHHWEGPGLWIEGCGSAEGEVIGCDFADTTGSGIGLLESQNIVVRGCTFRDTSIHVDVRGMDRGGEKRFPRDLLITDNTFGSGRTFTTSLWTKGLATPPLRNIVFEANRYEDPQTALFQHAGRKLRLQEVQQEWGWEKRARLPE